MKRQLWWSIPIVLCRVVCAEAQPSEGVSASKGGRFLAADGTLAAPAYSLASAPGVGFYKRRDGDGHGLLFAAGGGKGVIALTSGTLALESLHEIVWSSVPNVDTLSSVANDLRLSRDAPGTLSLRASGTAVPGLRMYSVYNGSSSANFERFAINSLPGAVVIRTEAAGNGTLRTLQLGTGTNVQWIFDARGNFGRGLTTPSITACGTSASLKGRDSAMVITVGTSGPTSTCAVTFGSAWTDAPACVVNSSTDHEPLTVSTTPNGLVIEKNGAFAAGSKLHIHCAGV